MRTGSTLLRILSEIDGVGVANIPERRSRPQEEVASLNFMPRSKHLLRPQNVVSFVPDVWIHHHNALGDLADVHDNMTFCASLFPKQNGGMSEGKPRQFGENAWLPHTTRFCTDGFENSFQV